MRIGAIGAFRPHPADFTKDRIKLLRLQTIKIAKSAPGAEITHSPFILPITFIRSFG